MVLSPPSPDNLHIKIGNPDVVADVSSAVKALKFEAFYLKKKMEILNVGQRELAEHAGVSQADVSNTLNIEDVDVNQTYHDFYQSFWRKRAKIIVLSDEFNKLINKKMNLIRDQEWMKRQFNNQGIFS